MKEYIEELRKLLSDKNPHLNISVSYSPERYDHLVRNVPEKNSSSNDYFIIFFRKMGESIFLHAISLYIPSLTIRIEASDGSYDSIPIEAIDADVKTYLYAKILQRQTWLFQRISENTWHLASGLSHQTIIQHVVDGALNTIPFSDAVIFRIYDEEQNKLRPVAVSGFNDNYYDYSVAPKESISGKVFESRKPIILKNKDDIIASFDSYSAIRASVMKNNPIAKSLICVPVFENNYCYGTLTTLSFGRSSVFNSLALSLLETFASQVALAWRNAKQYDEKVESFNKVNYLMQQLELQNQMLKNSLEFHNEMIKLSIKNNDIKSFIRAISDKINVEIGYIDISGEMHGKLYGIDKLRRDLTAVNISEESVETGFFRDDLYINPMIKNEQAVGFVVVKKSDASDHIRVMLSRLSDFLLMDIMKKVSSLLVENKRKSSIIQNIFLNGINEDTTTTLSENGFVINNWIGCAVMSLAKNESEEVKILYIHNKLKSLLLRTNSFFYSEGRRFIIYLSDDSWDKINSAFIGFENNFVRFGFHQTGLSNIISAVRIKQSLEQAITTLTVLEKRKKEGVLRFNKTGIERLFVNYEKEEIKSFIHDVLSPLVDGSEKNQVLLKTLIAYIKHGRSVNNTAKFLDIHTNTFYQRIRKVESLTKMNLSCPDDFLIISVACHMLSLP